MAHSTSSKISIKSTKEPSFSFVKVPLRLAKLAAKTSPGIRRLLGGDKHKEVAPASPQKKKK